MSTTVAAWNIREGLAQPNEMPIIIEQIKSFDADVVVLSDAYSLENRLHGSQADTLDTARNQLTGAGYTAHQTEYDDADPADPWRHDRHVMVLSRLAVEQAVRLRLGSRNAQEVVVRDPHTRELIRVVGAHFDDRSEDTRAGHIFSFLGSLDAETPTVLAGDLNAVHADVRWMPLLRSAAAQIIVDCLPPTRLRSKAQRVVDACSGRTLELLEVSNFHDADPECQPTFPAKFPFLQLDHLMLSSELTASDFYRARHRQVSNHSAIVAKLHIS